MYVTTSLSLYNVYNLLLYFILHSPLSFEGLKIAFKIFLSKTRKIVSSDFDNTHVSEPYANRHEFVKKKNQVYEVIDKV